MAKDYLELGPVPGNEECQQVGTLHYNDSLAVFECSQYRKQLERQFEGKIPEGCFFGVKSFSHEFGLYREVCVFYDDNNEEQIDFAYMVENNSPGEWDQISWDNLVEYKLKKISERRKSNYELVPA